MPLPFLPLSILLALVMYSLAAKWYVMPALRTLPLARALTPLLLFHSSRFIGLSFLVPGVTSEPLDPRFADHAAYGDLVAAVLALLSILALRQGWVIAVPLVWVFSVQGILDLINAVGRGVVYVPTGDFGATYFIPAVAVPALLVSHVVIIILLLRRERSMTA